MKLPDSLCCSIQRMPASAARGMQASWCDEVSPFRKPLQTLFMSLFAGLLGLAAVYSGCIQAATATAYYVLDADISLQQATVVSLEDGNTVTAGNTRLYLDSGEVGIVPVADLVQGTRISASAAFTLGNSVKGTDLPNPESFAGTRFSIPHKSDSHRYLLLSPDTTAQVSIESDTGTSHITLTAGQVYSQEMSGASGSGKSDVITSDVPILVQHKGYEAGDARYAYPVPPAAAELWGFRSKRILVGAADISANAGLYASNDDSNDEFIDQYRWVEIDVGDTGSEGRGDAVHIISDQPVSAVQFDDSDGREATAFFSSDYLATHFALPVDTRYVAVLCTQANTIITLYENGYNPDERPCSAGGLTPGKVYFGSSSDGVHMEAGARIVATGPVHLIYEDASSADEKNLLGFNLWGPSISVVNPGEQTHLETRNVSLQIKAAASEGMPLTYSATGLPPGLAIDADSGRVSGQVARGAAGSYTTMVTAADGIAAASIEFQWVITGGNIGIETIIHSGDYWKYLDDGSDQGALWRDPGADDSEWPEGFSQFGYGEGDETTVVDYGGDSSHKHITTYFRHEFILQDTLLVSDLAVRLMRDDGAVVYLNGHEVIRSNMPNGTIDYHDKASERVNRTDHGDIRKNENTFLDYSIDPAWLIDGVNVLAVEVHVYDDESEDMSFDLELGAAIDLVEDVIPPVSINLELVSFAASPGNTVITGAAGAAEAFARISLATAGGETVTAVANADGSFRITLDSDTDENVSITLADRHGNEGETVNVTAVGSTAGSFDVSPQGAGTYTIPLSIPPGIAAMQPGLSLAYNSQAGDGLLGPGWTLQGLSAISRCGTTRAQDGFIDGVDFDANDRFCLDGQRLIAVNGSYAGNATEYRTEIDSFSKIVSYTEAGTSGVAYFRVWTRSGQILEYGVSADSRIEATNRSDGAVLIWAVNRIEDTVGNYITTTYTESNSGEYYPLRIDYTGNDNAGVAPLASVSFSYSSRPGTKGYIAGSSVESTRIMSGITAQVGSAVVRTYRLAYRTGQATGRKRLVSIQECSLGACFPASVFTWQDMAGVDFDAVIASGHNGSGFNSRTSWADVNGDGLADWVRAGAAGTQVRLSNGAGGFAALIESANGAGNLYSRVSWADVNGDGLADWVRAAVSKTQVRLSNGDGTFGALIESAHGASYLHSYVSWVDVNGDGLADWVRAAVSKTQVRLSNGDGTFGALTQSAHGASYLHNSVSWVDVNGDGLADWVRAAVSKTQVRLSNGDGSFGVLTQSAHGASYLHDYVSWADVNGDGLADWVRAAGSKTQIRLSTGDGAFGALLESAHAAGNLYSRVSWADVNGDGLADWVRAAVSKTQVRLSNGDGTFGALIESAHGASYLHKHVSWVDVNGDGLTDWVRAGSAEIQARLHTGIRPDLITAISSGTGLQTNLVHTPLTDHAVYLKHTGSSYPVMDIQAPMYVISSSSTSDGLGGLYSKRYFYEGLKVDVSGRGMLGFARTTVTDSQTGIVTKTEYSQDFPLIGMVLRSETTLNNKRLSGLVNALESFTTASMAVYFPHVASSTRKSYELPGGTANLVTTEVTSNLYDPQGEGLWGNLSGVNVITSGGGESYVKDTIHHYQPADTVNWFLGRLASTSVHHSVNGAVPEQRKSAFEYDPGTGLLSAEIIEPGNTELELRSEYIHDAFGRKAVTTVRDSGAATHAIVARSSSSIYTPAGQADPARPYEARLVNTNALGHSETQWIDTRFGVVVSQTGPNGLTTYWSYDDFGRKTHEDRADGTWTDWDISWCGAHCADGGTSVTVETSGSSPVSSYADLLGREVRTATLGLDGTPVYQDTRYNSLGQVTGKSRPYYAGNSQYWTNYRYDALGRAREEHGPDGGRMETAYNGLSTTVRRYDTAGSYDQSVTRINNVQGKLREMIDEGQAHTFYNYDPAGNLVKVTDSAGNISTMGYDDRGRKTAMNDPDMGVWSYQYDALGQLRKQTDAKLQVVGMIYDPLGRMTQRTEVEGSSSWTYDTAVNGIGKPASVVNGANGFQKTFTYDNLGRLSSATSTIDAETFTMGYAYDNEGRRERTTYPTGFEVRNIYAGSGQLVEVRNAANDQAYWTAETVDAEGKVTEAFLGNGLHTWHVYDGASGHIKEINTGSVFGNGVQDLVYQFDHLGNLKARQDDNQDILGQPLKETFAYDSRNRLLSATIAGVGSRNYGYDALGNIRKKSDFGSNYSYGAGVAGPHAVTRVMLGGVEQAGYNYDANGNMTGGAGRSITWTSFNKASRITRGASTLTFTYDADHNRIKQVNGDHTTYYLSPRIDAGAHYEKEIDGALIEHKHYIYAAGQSIALHTTKSDGTGKTRYLHKDHLGSTDVITDESGNIVEHMSFEAFGSRRNVDWNTTGNGIAALEVHHGFTGHEHLDEVGIIHMNGRLYDPQLGRFLSPDVQVQYPENSQSFNRYSYVHNNPLSYTDPSGYGFFSKLWKGVKQVFKNKVFRVVVAVAAAYFTFNMASSWAWAVQTSTQAGVATAGAYTTAGIVGGAAGGFVAGGILSGSINGAIRGAVAGALFGGISGVYGNTWNAQRVAANSLAGGVSSEINGGRFKEGFRISMVLSLMTYSANKMRQVMVAQSRLDKRNATGQSIGSKGDGFKLGGSRENPNIQVQIPSPLGGIQGQDGRFFGHKYVQGSFMDRLTNT